MSQFDKLQRIPLDKDEYCKYEDAKKVNFDEINLYYNTGLRYGRPNAITSVNTFLEQNYYYMDENGMEKFVAMISGMLFEIEHDEVEKDQAYGTNKDIQFFETGEYDDLFTPEDLELIRKDIKGIKDYLASHPELLEDE